MTPLTKDIETCREVLGDGLCRLLSDEARVVAESGVNHKPYVEKLFTGGSWWDQHRQTMKIKVWLFAYHKRRARLQRKAKIKEK